MSKLDTNQASEDELRAEILTEFKQVYKLAPYDYTENCTNVVMALIEAEISKREQLLLDELEDAVGNAKYGEDQGFNYEQAVDDVYDFINAKRGKHGRGLPS